MGIFELFKQDIGTRAYRAHVKANRLNDTGKLAEAEAQYAKAMEMYEEAEKKGFESPRIVTGYCVLLMRQNLFAKAEPMLAEMCGDPAIKDDDKYLLKIDHAVCAWKLGDIEGALNEMQVLSSKKIGLYYNVMSAILVQKAHATDDYAEAEEFCAKAIEYDDDDIICINAMGWLKYYTGDRENAKKYFKKAAKQNERYAPALVGLALMCHEEGNSAKAKELIDRALAVHYPTTTPVSRKDAEELKKQIG